jgi:hypothetical protein
MRLVIGGIAHVSCVIEDDLFERSTGLHKPHVEGLADLVACVLSCRSANTAEWQAILPRKTGDLKSKERYINRFLSNPLINPVTVMGGFIPEIAEMAMTNGKTIILMIDQSKISDGFECLMVSMRVGERAIPVAWKVMQTKGEIGFDEQEPLLGEVVKMMPAGADILLAADRFYGTAALINWCQKHGWKYRIRLKGNLILQHEGGEITTGAAANAQISSLIGAELNETGIKTNIGILHENGHKEAWIIAMSEPPNKGRVLDYGMRWGIECMFSDFKSRGFGITKTKVQHTDRIERLILVLTIALYWAASTGMQPKKQQYTQKKKSVA